MLSLVVVGLPQDKHVLWYFRLFGWESSGIALKVWVCKDNRRIETSCNALCVVNCIVMQLRYFTFSLPRSLVEISNRLQHRKTGFLSFAVVAKRFHFG